MMTQMETVYALSAAMSAEIACFEAYVAAQRSFTAAIKAPRLGRACRRPLGYRTT